MARHTIFGSSAITLILLFGSLRAYALSPSACATGTPGGLTLSPCASGIVQYLGSGWPDSMCSAPNHCMALRNGTLARCLRYDRRCYSLPPKLCKCISSAQCRVGERCLSLEGRSFCAACSAQRALAFSTAINPPFKLVDNTTDYLHPAESIAPPSPSSGDSTPKPSLELSTNPTPAPFEKVRDNMNRIKIRGMSGDSCNSTQKCQGNRKCTGVDLKIICMAHAGYSPFTTTATFN